ncbi:MAG: hypothetical protein Kow0010_00640 [Dehalococcoidia bacterium]
MSAVAGPVRDDLAGAPHAESAERAIDRVAEAVWFCRWAALDDHPDVRAALDDLTVAVLSWSHRGPRYMPEWPALLEKLVALGLHVSTVDDPATGGRLAYATRLLDRAVSGVRAVALEADYGRSRFPMM